MEGISLVAHSLLPEKKEKKAMAQREMKHQQPGLRVT